MFVLLGLNPTDDSICMCEKGLKPEGLGWCITRQLKQPASPVEPYKSQAKAARERESVGATGGRPNTNRQEHFMQYPQRL